MTNSQWDTIVVGAGAAGLWAAGTAALRGRSVLLLEKNNKAGPKILMSGGTRCNVTHHCDSRKIAEAFGKNGRALLSPLKRLSPQDVVREFLSMGVPTKVEETGKVFPESDRAIDVRDALVQRLSNAGAILRTGQPVRSVRRSSDANGFEVVLDNEIHRSSTILITTGGLSYSGCGTTGDGYPWVQSFGHTLTPLRPALTPLISSAEWVHRLSGITLDDASVTAVITQDGKLKKGIERMNSRGGLLYTHFGCSGPTAMNVSRSLSDLDDYSHAGLSIDVVPNLSNEECDRWLIAESKGTRSILNTLVQHVPRRLAEALLEQADVRHEQRMAELSKPNRMKIVQYMKSWPMPIHGTRGYPKAEVTAGGVELGEVNFQDMQSRLTPGLFLAGEILDLDGPIGGFNFQAAWSTGHTAGLHL